MHVCGNSADGMLHGHFYPCAGNAVGCRSRMPLQDVAVERFAPFPRIEDYGNAVVFPVGEAQPFSIVQISTLVGGTFSFAARRHEEQGHEQGDGSTQGVQVADRGGKCFHLLRGMCYRGCSINCKLHFIQRVSVWLCLALSSRCSIAWLRQANL